MAKGKKTGGRRNGTPNKLTLELRDLLTAKITEIPELLEQIEDPQTRLNYLIKLVPYVLPKPKEIDAIEEDENDQLRVIVFGASEEIERLEALEARNQVSATRPTERQGRG